LPEADFAYRNETVGNDIYRMFIEAERISLPSTSASPKIRRRNWKECAMRLFWAAAIIGLWAGSAYAQQGVPDKMGGTGYSKQFSKTCSVYANACVLNNPGAKEKCESARAKCMATGTFTGPQGKSFSGLAKQ
jgi:hypothetical protein